MKIQLDQLESRLQALIEVKLLSVLPGLEIDDFVIQKFAHAMKNNLLDGEKNTKIAPSIYTLVAHPDTLTKWQDPLVLEALKNSIKDVGEESGLAFKTPPVVLLSPNSGQKKGFFQVVASHQSEIDSDTRGMTPVTPPTEQDTSIPENAFIIINGVKVFPLEKMVINIGRKLDNHLVIDDPRISRNHAQLRAIKGRFIIFDLNSTGGVFVNGQRTKQSVLYPGDVISLAGVPLVFGQDNPPSRPDLADTEPLNDVSSGRPTAFLRHITSELIRAEEKKNKKNRK